jgi:hypothetical protein
VIGVYEPIVLASDPCGGVTSIAASPEHRALPAGELLHRACASRRRSGEGDAPV